MKLAGSESAPSLPYRPDIQGLRAIAVTLVVLAHAGLPILAGGFVGVDVFFVLSGYLITGLLLRELARHGRISFAQFYARRLRRLLPALIAVLLVTAGAAASLLSIEELQGQLASAPFAASWTSNFHFAFRELGYFDELAIRDLFLHTWSLGVEEQFYLAWPLLMLAVYLFARRTKIAEPRTTALAALGLALVSSLALSLYWTSNAPHAAFYMMPSRIWQFALGAMVFVAYECDSSLGTNAGARPIFGDGSIPLGLGLTLIVGGAVGLHPGLAYPGLWAVAPSLGTALVIAAGHSGKRHGPLAHPALVWVGDRSYSWYLWHWPILILGQSMGIEPRLLPLTGLILLSLLAAILSYRLVELPLWKGRMRHARARPVLMVSLLAMAATVATSFHGLRSLPPLETISDTSRPWRADVPIIYSMPCDAWYSHARVEPCVFGSADASKSVVLLGDSIGVQWFSMVTAIFPEPEWRTIVLTKSACPIVDEDFFYERIGQVYRVCTEWRRAVIEELERLEPEVVIIGSAASYEFSETQWVEGTSRILARLSTSAPRILVIPGTPTLAFDGPGCLSRNPATQGEIDRDACVARERMEVPELVTRLLKRAAASFHNTHVLDLNDLVCPGRICNAVSADGIAVFRDSQHLSDAFVRSQIPVIRNRIDPLVAGLGNEHQ